MGRISRDVDNDSVISEPASYSNGAFVASDMWLVQKDVQPAESALADKQRRRRQRMKQLDDPRALRQAVSVSAANPSIYDEDKETGSSRLVNQFFSGGLSPYLGCPRRNERIGSADLWSDNNVTRGFPDTDIANYRYPEKDEQEYPYYSTKQDTYSTEPARHTEFGAAGRKISRARRLRWWIRRVSYRVRGEWEYV